MGDKPLLHRVGDKVTDKLLEWLIGVAGAAMLTWLVLARHWIANEWACVNKQWCEVEGWSLGLLIAFAVAVTAATMYLGIRLFLTHRALRAALAAVPAKVGGDLLMVKVLRLTIGNCKPGNRADAERQCCYRYCCSHAAPPWARKLAWPRCL